MLIDSREFFKIEKVYEGLLVSFHIDLDENDNPIVEALLCKNRIEFGKALERYFPTRFEAMEERLKRMKLK